MQNINSMFSHPMVKNIDKELEKVFQGFPHLPKKVTEILAKIAPYLILVSGLFLITGGLRSIFGANDFYRIFNFWKGIPPIYFYLTGLLQILIGALSLIAYEPLKNRKMDGWIILFFINAIQLLMNIISVFFFKGGLFGLLLSLAIGLYVLYEMKPEYSMIKTVIVKVDKAKIKIKKIEKQVKSKLKKK